MERATVRGLLDAIATGKLKVGDAEERLATLLGGEAVLDGATVDLDRHARTGHAEVIYGEGKTARQVIAIASRMLDHGQDVIVTRIDTARCTTVRGALRAHTSTYDAGAKVLVARSGEAPPRVGNIVVVSAGTSDAPVASEAAVCADALGNNVERVDDVGVAGLHRLLRRRAALREARVVVVVAGMDGALPGVVAGLVSCPVVAVPTSVGYGASFGGVAALLTMLNACAPGVSVVNIDNGFGAAMVASRINHLGA